MNFAKLPKLVAIGLSVVTLAGCETIGGWFAEDDYDPTAPVELTDIEQKVKLSKRWSTSIGDGQGKGFYKITPALAEGTLYVAATEGLVAAVDAASGRKL